MIVLAIIAQLLIAIGVILVVVHVIGHFVGSEKAPTKKRTPLDLPAHFGWLMGALVVAYNVFFHQFFMTSFERVDGTRVTSLGFALFSIAVIAVLFASFKKKERSRLVYTMAAIGTLASLAFMFRVSELVQWINGIAVLGSVWLLLLMHSVKKVEWNGVWMIKNIPTWTMQKFGHITNLLDNLLYNDPKRKNRALAVLKTTLLALIVVLFFAWMLSKADPVFDQLIAEIKEEALERIGLSLLIAVMATYILTLRLKPNVKIKESTWLSFHDLAVPATGMIILFGVFLAVQAKYLFTTGVDFSSFELTYSEYVRKGFKELLWTTFFASLVSYTLMLRQSKEKEARNVMWLKGLNVVLVIELFALLGSALQRNLLYIDAHGLTRMRIIGMVFLAWLALALLALLVVGLHKKLSEKHLLQSMLAASVAGLLFCNIVNVDQMVVNSNPREDGFNDYFYLASLSDDAVLGWVKAIEDTKTEFNAMVKSSWSEDDSVNRFVDMKLAMNMISTYYEDVHADQDEYSGAMFWNWGRANALSVMDENESLFTETLPCLVEELHDFQIHHAVNSYSRESFRINQYNYPLVSLRHPWEYTMTLETMLGNAADEAHIRSSYGYIASDKVAMEQLQEVYIPEACQ